MVIRISVHESARTVCEIYVYYTAAIIMHSLTQITCTTACNECGTIHVAGFCGQYKVYVCIVQDDLDVHQRITCPIHCDKYLWLRNIANASTE